MPTLISILALVGLLGLGSAVYLLKQLGGKGEDISFLQAQNDALVRQLNKTWQALQAVQQKEKQNEAKEASQVHDATGAADFGNRIMQNHGGSTGAPGPVLKPNA